MAPEESGAGAQTIVRDRRGRKLSAYEMLQKQSKGSYVDEDERNMVWGKGLVQQAEAESARDEMREELESGFARGRDDARLNAALAERDRWGDPMLDMVKTKKKKRADAERKAAAQQTEGPRRLVPRPMYEGTPWPNRFGILPGYRWDGVDRSNKWEERLFRHGAEKKAMEVEAYRWSVENM